MVRAKFRVTSITRHEQGGCEPPEMHTVKMVPVYGNNDPNHENSKFWKWTPAGEISLGTINPDAAKAFEIGGEYYVDFTPAPKT